MAGKALSSDQLRHVADRFKALSEPSRLEILQALRQGERTVTDILSATGLTQANASRHLRVLHDAGLVERRKDGLNAWYRLADADVLRLCELMCGRLERETAVRRRLFG